MFDLADPTLLRHSSFIDGTWVNSRHRQFTVVNPSTGEEIAVLADGDSALAEEAISAASEAFQSWRQKTAKERARLLKSWYELVISHQTDLATILTAEQGKPLPEAASEIEYGANYIEYYAEECKRVMGDTIPTIAADRRLLTLKQPVGVVGCITPWNFPMAMIARKVGPALAAGCTVVVKPAAETPLSALALCVLAERAGIPSGVINVVVGTDAIGIGKALTDHPVVRKLTFTGSTRVGQQLMAQCASTVKKVSLELGGNAPFVVFDDADIDEAVSQCVATKFRNAGQTCVCTNRVFVHRKVAEIFATKLARAVSELRVGDGFESDIDVGPLIDQRAVTRVKELVREATLSGANVLFGGDSSELGPCFYQPTVLTGINAEMRIAKEEIFGPVAAIQTFMTEKEAIDLANNTEYGLAAYFFSRDVGRVLRVSEQLEYGIVSSNSGVFSTEVAPFGGWKYSGIGSEGGKEGIAEYHQTKFHSMGGVL